MSVLAVDRPEPADAASFARLRPVGQRNEDDVALVALHVLEVLDEQLLAPCLGLFAVALDSLILDARSRNSS